MKFLVVGPGKMGRSICKIAESRGHRCVGEWTAGERPESHDAELAFEFSRPQSAADNVTALLDAGISVVCGTTGWESDALERRPAKDGVGWIVAANFSIGMHVFSRIVREAAATAGRTGLFRSWIVERHHRAKRDNPSGTARQLARLVQSYGRGIGAIEENGGDRVIAPDALHVVGVRTGSEPGTHTVGFDGEFDEISMTHRARSRDGFAQGAVLAAEWLLGRTGGFRFDEVVEALWDTGVSDGRED